jgi:hypothetical protein
MKKPLVIALMSVVILAGVCDANVTGKLGNIKIATPKKGDYPVISYSYNVTSDLKRIKRPVISFYLIVEHPDTSRSTHYAEYNPSWKWDQGARSKREPEIEASTVRSVQGRTSGSPFFPNYVHNDKDKIVVLRCELWLDGVILDECTSKSANDLEKLGIPLDWHKKK